jgi:uncharacterized protein (DUF1800 family)
MQVISISRGYRMLHRVAKTALVLITVSLVASSAAPASTAAAPTVSEATAVHVLNRLTYGPRPGDIAELQRMGVGPWIERQLSPDRIDNRALEARLETFATLSLDMATLMREYHEPALRERRQRQQEAGRAPATTASRAPASTALAARPEDDPAMTPDTPGGRPRPSPTEAQRKDRQIMLELEEAKLLRAVASERQLEEVLVDFWFNHFNVFAGKGQTRAFITAYERDAIRPHVLGSFRAMLEAVAASPAMLFYLDNWRSTANRPQGGINENYARELLELHTLGVDGGYTQTDIVHVARAFTGWTFQPRQGARFRFATALHDRDAKTVLGQAMAPGGGIEEGRRVLDILVGHPSTARHLATKLAQKFVSDTPPPALVERAARRFTETRGDLREVTRVILLSPEFLAADAHRAKVKTPLEFVASALRATNASVRTALPLARTLRELGQPPYFCQPPTGYDEAGDRWVSSGALVARMNFAQELASGRLRGIALADSAAATADTVLATALAGSVSPATTATLDRATTAEQRLALLIGSPDFQRQ